MAAVYATIEDFRNFREACLHVAHLHHSGGTVCEPVDIPVAKRHLEHGLFAHPLFRQALHGLGHGAGTRRGFGRHAEMVFGKDFVDQNCVLINLINANSPMVFDGTMVGAPQGLCPRQPGQP